MKITNFDKILDVLKELELNYGFNSQVAPEIYVVEKEKSASRDL